MRTIKRRVTTALFVALAICSCSGEKKQSKPAVQESKCEVAEQKVEENKGTNFQNITLQEAIDKAKSEGKLVFIECHTNSCGPCRMMKKSIFPQSKIGEYMNEHFVAIMQNMEEGEGLTIAKKYGVAIYPTYLIVDTEGNCVGQIIGADKDADSFLSKIQEVETKAKEVITNKK